MGKGGCFPGRPLGCVAWPLRNVLMIFIDNENFLLYHFIMNESIWKAKWSKDQIKAMLLEQFDSFWRRDTGLERAQLAEIERAAKAPHNANSFRWPGILKILLPVSVKSAL